MYGLFVKTIIGYNVLSLVKQVDKDEVHENYYRDLQLYFIKIKMST